MNKVLITGASGFIGRHCVPLLLGRGYELHALTRATPAGSSSERMYWHECDLLSPGRAAEIVDQVRPNHLLHLAWYAVPGKFWEAAENSAWVQASEELALAFAKSGGQRMVGAHLRGMRFARGRMPRGDDAPSPHHAVWHLQTIA